MTNEEFQRLVLGKLEQNDKFQMLVLEHMAKLTQNMAEMKQDITELKDGQSRIEETVESISRRISHQAMQLSDHDRELRLTGSRKKRMNNHSTTGYVSQIAKVGWISNRLLNYISKTIFLKTASFS